MKKQFTSGFVYIWRDRKHKRYYIGSHWGLEDDGYICSSSWMKKAYIIRPNDFKRRILSKVITTRKDLLIEENKWLNMIHTHELGVRYYNLHNHEFNHWSADEKRRVEVCEKISKINIGRKQTFKDPVARGHKISETKKKKFAETGGFTEEHKQKLALAHKSKKHTKEWKDSNSKRLKEQWASGQRIPKKRDKPVTDEFKQKMRELNIGRTLSSTTKEKLSIRKTFKVGEKIYKNYTRKEICDTINIPYGSYYYNIKSGKIQINK